MEAYWLAFSHIDGMGPVRLRHLYTHFGDMQQAWLADSETLRALNLPDAVVKQHATLQRSLNPQDLIDAVHALDAYVVTLDHPDFPPLLKEISNAPALLYVRGSLSGDDHRAIGIVGTRRASQYGQLMTKRIAADLARHGVTIVSGLAHGIDAVAHQTALEVGARTIAVLGSGIDVIYPSDHRYMAEQIMQSGALITEFPPSTKPMSGNFPTRNRLISGLSLGVVVVEAPQNSGALSTAQYAGEQGRDVFAVPGNANSSNSRGTNRLIQDGAKLVIDTDDIIRELDLAFEASEVRQVVTQLAPENPLEARLLDLLKFDTMHVDELSRQCGLSIQVVNQALVLMELKGLIFQTAPLVYSAAD